MTTFSKLKILDVDLTPYMRIGADSSTLAQQSWQAHLQKFTKSTEELSKLQDELDKLKEEELEYTPFELDDQRLYGRINIYEEDTEYIIVISR